MNKKKMNKNPRGFIALISAVIISAVLLVMAGTESVASYYARENVLYADYKAKSVALADACVEETLLKLARNPDYAGDATTTVGSDTCHTGSILTNGNQKTFKTQGIFDSSFTSLQIVVDSSTLSILSYVEVD